MSDRSLEGRLDPALIERAQGGDLHAFETLLAGRLVATPKLRCLSKPLPSGVPDFRCDEMDWLTDEPFVPMIDGSIQSPLIGIRVPNGSFAEFMADRDSLAGLLGSRQGTFVVRRSVLSTCDFIGHGSDPACAGGITVVTVIERRLSP